MTQPSLLDLPTPRLTKRGRVPRSSVLAYQERPRDGRIGDVLRWMQLCGDGCTSAELASLARGAVGMGVDMDFLLYVRRGLSDALSAGLVRHAGERKCAVSGRQCVTWAVVTR